MAKNKRRKIDWTKSIDAQLTAGQKKAFGEQNKSDTIDPAVVKRVFGDSVAAKPVEEGGWDPTTQAAALRWIANQTINDEVEDWQRKAIRDAREWYEKTTVYARAHDVPPDEQPVSATNPPPRVNTLTPPPPPARSGKAAKGNPPARAGKGTLALPKGGSLTKAVKDPFTGLPRTQTAKPGHYFDEFGNDMLLKYGEMPAGGSKSAEVVDPTWGLKETKTAPPGKYYGPDGKLHDLPAATPPPKPTGGKVTAKQEKTLREIGAWVAGPAAAKPAAKATIPTTTAAFGKSDMKKQRKVKKNWYSPGR